MRRNLEEKIMHWMMEGGDTMLFLDGSLGSGKTHLVLQTLQNQSQTYQYINILLNPKAGELFEQGYKETLAGIISLFLGNKQAELNENKIGFVMQDKYLVLDEFGNCPEYFRKICELRPLFLEQRIHIIFITSFRNKEFQNLFVQAKKHQILQCYTLYPMGFDEFLGALNYDWYADAIRDHFETGKALPDMIHNDLLQHLDQYLMLGGMPAAIAQYCELKDVLSATQIHEYIRTLTREQGQKFLPKEQHLKFKKILENADLQLQKNNTKFQYTTLKKGATKQEYLETIDFCTNHHLFYKLRQITTEGEVWNDSFKLYPQDVGMFLSKATRQEIMSNQNLSKGIVESYVASNLLQNDAQVYFWESTGKAKVDFLIKERESLTPVIVQYDNSTHQKNISVMKSSFENTSVMNSKLNFNVSVKFSMDNFSYKKNMKNIPLYALFSMKKHNI
ncbi:MAG: DUF4143 domain-containing protein [Lachnospiraceae bacterium]|nr:DUF4143 domain-containing protein [Lachnospiraceae bacterium]